MYAVGLMSLHVPNTALSGDAETVKIRTRNETTTRLRNFVLRNETNYYPLRQSCQVQRSDEEIVSGSIRTIIVKSPGEMVTSSI